MAPRPAAKTVVIEVDVEVISHEPDVSRPDLWVWVVVAFDLRDRARGGAKQVCHLLSCELQPFAGHEELGSFDLRIWAGHGRASSDWHDVLLSDIASKMLSYCENIFHHKNFFVQGIVSTR